MRPLKFEEAKASFLANRYLLLDRGAAGWRYLEPLLSRDPTSVRSKGGIGLPLELWNNILDLAYEPHFVLVKPKLKSWSKKKKVLSCQEAELGSRLGWLHDSMMVEVYEKLLNTGADIYSGVFDRRGLEEMMEEPPAVKMRWPRYRVVLHAEEKQSSCLFAGITVPDVIARLEGGRCSLCGGKRVMCAGCEGQDFDLYMDARCGPIVACPLCVGISLSLQQHDLLDDPDYSFRRARNMDRRVNKALKKLGYPPIPPKTPLDFDD